MRPILTADAMRAAERQAIAAGTPVGTLMERAGAALADAARRFAGSKPALVLCGPGNNGGDGYVAARHLIAHGIPVRVAAMAEPTSNAARAARAMIELSVEQLGPETRPEPLLIDALFGTGLSRALDEQAASHLTRLVEAASVSVACDLPSGVETDSGGLLGPVPHFDLTVTFGALKPAHRLMPSMLRCGRVVLADIGLDPPLDWHEIGRPTLPPLDAAGHKYDRGLVQLLAGKMPGAIALAASAAARAGAGYVRIASPEPIAELPSAIVRTGTAEVDDPRIGCLLVGPGMGDLPQLLTLALTSRAPKVIDADGLNHVGRPERLRGQDAVITPHAGEFARLFGEPGGSKADQALQAARASGATVVYKGPDTLVASPDGRLGFAPPAPAWLASAGTGDVLAGIIAAFRARGLPAFDAACAAVWVHGRAAEQAGSGMIADDLAAAIPAVLAEL